LIDERHDHGARDAEQRRHFVERDGVLDPDVIVLSAVGERDGHAPLAMHLLHTGHWPVDRRVARRAAWWAAVRRVADPVLSVFVHACASQCRDRTMAGQHKDPRQRCPAPGLR
jgi:hypothetical protein